MEDSRNRELDGKEPQSEDSEAEDYRPNINPKDRFNNMRQLQHVSTREHPTLTMSYFWAFKLNVKFQTNSL